MVGILIATVFTVAVPLNMNVGGSPPGLASYWKFNEGSGSNTYDSLTSNYGTLYGPSWTSGVEGSCLTFDNVGGPTTYDYVEIEYSSTMRLTGDWSISAWLRPNSLAEGLFPGRSSGKYMSQSQYWHEHNGIVLSVVGTWISAYLYTGRGDPGWDGWDTEGFNGNAFADGDWHELVFAFDSSSLTLKVHVDRVLVGAKTIDGPILYTKSQSTWLGRTGRGNDVWNPYSGEIDELKIYHTDISSYLNTPPVANSQSKTTNEDTSVAITLTASDADGDPLTYSIVNNPSLGTLSGTPPNLVYSPFANVYGSDSFTFKVNDGFVDSNIATVSITINPVNDPPIAFDQTVTIDEDTQVSFTLSAVDFDGDSLFYYILSWPPGGFVGSAPNLIYSPPNDYSGTVLLTFKANDGTVDSNLGIVTIDILPVNDAPVASGQNLNTDEDTDLAIILSATDVESDPLTFSIVDSPIHGTVGGSPPTLTYTPDSNYHGSDSFTFKANDGSLDSNTATVNIVVDSINDAPLAYGQGLTTYEDTDLAITIAGSDVDGDSLTYHIVDSPTHGTLSGTPPSLTYSPDLNFFGTDSFTFKVNDGTVDSNVATVTITVLPINDPPIAYDQSVSTDEDTSVAITLTGFDVENDPLTFIVVSPPSHGTLSGTPPDLTYTPDADYNGFDSFTFKVNDGLLDSNIATVSITINPVNDAPIADDQTVTIDEDVDVVIVLGASDIDGDSLTYLVLSGPSHGTLSGSGKTLTYSPAADYHGSDTFTFKANDGSEDSNTATVTININSVNDAPEANDQSLNTDEDIDLSITLTASDVEGDSLTYLVVTAPIHGTLSGTAPDLTYSPDANYYGSDSLTFEANDGFLDSNTATISITIDPVNDAPIAYDQSPTTDEDIIMVITLNTMDFDGDTLSYTILSGPSHGTLSGTEPTLTYTPDGDYNGADSFTFNANDGFVDSNTATVSITINPVNDPPVANANGPYSADEASPITFDASSSSDVDGDALEYHWDFENDGIWDTSWSNDPTATHTWPDDHVGDAVVEVTDGVFMVSAMATVTVNNVAPTVDAGAEQAASVLETVSFSGSFSDPGTDTHTAIWDWDDTTFSYGTISGGSVSGSHIYTAAGVYTVTLSVEDDDGLVGSDWCTVIIYEGTGTVDDPYKITNVQQLQAMKHDLNGHYILMNDIDASDTVNWNSGAGFEPIGYSPTYWNYNNIFAGSLDGNGYKITDLNINRPSERNVGLIGVSMNGKIMNVALENADITGWYYTGGLVGYNSNGNIEDSYLTGSVNGQSYTGGLVGYNYGSIRNSYVSAGVTGNYNVGGIAGSLSYGSTITNCYAEGSVSGSWSRVGGLAGSNSNGEIIKSYATNSVSGSNWVGGLVGYQYGGQIRYSYATGDITGTSYLGGLVGQTNYRSYVKYSYATGSVSGSTNLGGLIGKNYRGTISNSYAHGDVSGTRYVGGLTGHDSGTTTNSYSIGAVSGSYNYGGLIGYTYYSSSVTGSYWDTDTSGQSTSAAGIGMTTIELKEEDTYIDWDYIMIWDIDEGVTYPYHLWETGDFFAGGSGTAVDPYQIENVFQLQNMIIDTGAYYILMNDIDASSTKNWNNGEGFEPIGSYSSGFSGSLDGDGYKITDLYINLPSTYGVGLFGGLASPGEVKNVGLKNMSYSGYGYVGGLVGYNNDGSITTSYAEGKVKGYYSTGGLVGYNVGTITCSYTVTNVSGNYYTGGLAGSNFRGTIENSYAMGSVHGNLYQGGLVGYNFYLSTITKCFSNSSVTGGSSLGGFIGYNYYSATVTDSYWDTESSGTTKGVGLGSSTGITGKTTAEMKQEATFINWDFVDIWGIIEGETYPYLIWQNVPPVANSGGPYNAPEGTEITFDASSSFDLDGDPLEYRWDFDNDGTWDTGWSSDPTASYTWYDDYTGIVRVEVSDGQSTSTDTASVIVSNVNPKAVISGSIGIGEDYIFFTSYTGQSYFIDIEEDGSLTSPQLMDVKGSGTFAAGIGDFDNDGDLDSLVGDRYNVWYYEKIGEGNNFAEPVSIDTRYNYFAGDFAEADLNNDGNLDAVKSTIFSGYLTIYLGNGDGTFSRSTTPCSRYTQGLDSGDFDGDGNTDLVTISRYLNEVNIFLGNGDGTFQSPTRVTTSGRNSYGVCAGDFDNDGDDDIITSYYPAKFYPNDGDGTFGTPTDLGFSGIAIAELDIDDDGNLDLVYSYGNTVYIRTGNGDGTFSLLTSYVSPSYGIYGVASSSEVMIVEEGEDTPYTGTFTDPGYMDTHTATWDWGDGSPIEDGIVTEENEYPDSTGEVTGSHAYADNGYYTIILTVTDNGGDQSTDTGKVKVLNVAPTASIDSVDSPVPGFILPDDEIDFTGSFTDPGSGDTHTIKWDFDDGTVLDDVTLTETHTYEEAGEYVVALTVTDDDGASDTVTVLVKVNSLDEATEQIDDYIQDLPESAFESNAEQLQNALYEKLIENEEGDAVLQLIAAELYQEALEKLRNDIRTKCDGHFGGNPANDWITDEAVQEELLAMIDALIAYLESLLEE
jgi:hypothetical protein